MKLSVVIPVMNERDNIEPLLESVYSALDGYIEYELILVDDGSSDDTVAEIAKLAKSNTRVLVFNRNYGQTTAMAAGIESANGELIVTLDGDLQNDPTDILPMIEKLESEGWDVVAGRRLKRQDGMFLRKIPSKIANYIIRRSTGVYISDYGCTLKVFTKDVAKNLELYGELHRFIPVLAKIYGAKITEMDVKHHARTHGVSKYGIGRTSRVISDLMLMLFMQKYRVKPMHLFGTLGLFTFVPGVLINFYLLILKLLGNDIGHRPLLTLGIVLVLAGIQLITTGFLAELIMRTYFESQNKKPYTIKETIVGTQENE
ncbi:Glycosyl transferase, family 2 [hydrothermal vent metagenome]|uniref:Glycosyl transferase, family 2 n=1 Tax=hydrothermal vent metagenome TaxID=652676 RepID=A0A1W1BY35_9ZZZZ